MEPDPQAPRSESPDTAPVVLPSGRLEGRELFRRAVRDALACAADQGWHELILSDASFEDWPLGESAVVAEADPAGAPLRRHDDAARAVCELAPDLEPPDRLPWLPQRRSAGNPQRDLEPRLVPATPGRGALHDCVWGRPAAPRSFTQHARRMVAAQRTSISSHHAGPLSRYII